MRICVAIVAIVCLTVAFLCAPAMHHHFAPSRDSRTAVHSHFDAHSDDTSGDRSSASGHNPKVRYVSIFQAHIVSPFSLDLGPTTEPRLSQRDSVFLLPAVHFEADGHSPPLLDQLPARSPPSIASSVLA